MFFPVYFHREIKHLHRIGTSSPLHPPESCQGTQEDKRRDRENRGYGLSSFPVQYSGFDAMMRFLFNLLLLLPFGITVCIEDIVSGYKCLYSVIVHTKGKGW